jgi:hypothetical protein
MEQKFITDTISDFINSNLDIELNNAKSYLRHNEIHFLGFKMVRSGHNSIWILIEDVGAYTKSLKKFKFNTYEQCQDFIRWFRGILNYFDIANNMGNLLSRIYRRLYYRSRHSKLRKIDNVFVYSKGRNQTIIDIYALRKSTRTSFKEYLIKKQWLIKRELLQNRESEKSFNGTFQYLWSLWTLQRGKDAVTKENLNPYDAQIHHIKPISKGGTNSLDNLILVSSKTHQLIHNGKDLDKRFEKYRKHLK